MLRKKGTDHYAVEGGCVFDLRERAAWSSRHRFLDYIRGCHEEGRPCFREHSLEGGQDPEYTVIPPEQLEVVVFDPTTLSAEALPLTVFLETHASNP